MCITFTESANNDCANNNIWIEKIILLTVRIRNPSQKCICVC